LMRSASASEKVNGNGVLAGHVSLISNNRAWEYASPYSNILYGENDSRIDAVFLNSVASKRWGFLACVSFRHAMNMLR